MGSSIERNNVSSESDFDQLVTIETLLLIYVQVNGTLNVDRYLLKVIILGFLFSMKVPRFAGFELK